MSGHLFVRQGLFEITFQSEYKDAFPRGGADVGVEINDAAGGDIADDAVEQRTRFLNKGRAHFLHELAAVSGE